ncbi:15762_t:CDS:1 [Cetraspora pellucida]|uniref:15762_t:CDS:1 n=1 Tax=Cetraspora pellucida TaxID=1433469 RepID=A0A9N9H8B7_9GLOM|nr:15762_t:CDS:1 [Cetraspora pellucida]
MSNCSSSRPPPPGYCYNLSTSDLTSLGFPYSLGNYGNNTIHQPFHSILMDSYLCVDHCADLAFQYAAIINNNTDCWCGDKSFDNYTSQPQQLNASICFDNSNCAACFFQISITESHFNLTHGLDTNTKLNIIINNTRSCIQDYPVPHRVLDCYGEHDSLTLDICINICKDNNYSGCAGVEDGTQCFCGNSSQCNNLAHGVDNLGCSSSCVGYPSQICGGPWAINYASIPITSSTASRTNIPSTSPASNSSTTNFDMHNPLLITLIVVLAIIVMVAIIVGSTCLVKKRKGNINVQNGQNRQVGHVEQPS